MGVTGKGPAALRAAQLFRAALDGQVTVVPEWASRPVAGLQLCNIRSYAAVPASDQDSDIESWTGGQSRGRNDAPREPATPSRSSGGEEQVHLPASQRWARPGAANPAEAPRFGHQRGDAVPASSSGRRHNPTRGTHRWLVNRRGTPSTEMRPHRPADSQGHLDHPTQGHRFQGRPSLGRDHMQHNSHQGGRFDRYQGVSQRPQPKPKPAPKRKPAVTEITLPEEVSVAQLASMLEVPVQEVEAALTDAGNPPASDQDVVPFAAAELAAMTFGIAVNFPTSVLERNSDAVSRPPVVTVMGHVDHGKTTLLDALRRTSVAASEAGGITQAIGAFQVSMPGGGGIITFLDTPGHAAFSAMRARGAAVTDLAVLVVAADDGIKPQTLEALAHARAAGCPMVVALTKCDMAGADPARARRQLMEHGVELEEGGGSVQVVETAAPQGKGLQQLEEALLFQAELMELTASPTRPALGVVVEARLDKGQGAVATVIIRRGTLKVGQYVVLGAQWGKVRALREASGALLKAALPGTPVEVSGLRGMPMAGDDFMVQSSEENARRLSEARQLRQEAQQQEAKAGKTGAAGADGNGEEGTTKQLTLLVKADTQGSCEAVTASLEALSSPAVAVKALPAGLGPVTSSDIDAAVSMGARLVAFNVRTANAAVDSSAKQHGIELLRGNIIYRLIQEVGEWMAALAPHVEEEVVVGEADVQQMFPLRGANAGVVAGCRVTTGSMAAEERFRLLRGGNNVWEGRCASLKRQKQDVHRVGKGTDCGVLLEDCIDLQPGDVLQCISMVLKPQAVEDVVASSA